MQKNDLVIRLKKRAEIRRSIPRGEPDRISDLLEEAANQIEELEKRILQLEDNVQHYRYHPDPC